MALALSDLLKPLDKTAVLTDLYAIGQALGLTTTAWQPGEPVPVVLATVVGWAVDKLWNPIVVPALSAPFLDYNGGNWLSLEAWSRYFRPRILSTFATGPVTLENRGSFTGTLAVGQVRIKSGPSGKTYTNTTAGTLTPWAGLPAAYPTVTLTFEADTSGSASNAQPGDIAAYPTPLVTGPANVFAQANGPPLLGSDQEPDDRLKTRCRDAAAELSSSGPRAALEGIALDPLGAFTRRGFPLPTTWGTVSPTITRVRIVDTGAATATVYLASDTGPAAGTASTPGTDVYKASVALLLFGGAAGVTLTTAPANANTINFGTITLYIDSAANVSAADAVTGGNLALAYWLSRLAIGGSRKTGGGTGYLFANQVADAVGTWQQPLPDGSGGVYFPKIPGLLTVDLTLADTALGAGDVVVASWTLQAQIVDQS